MPQTLKSITVRYLARGRYFFSPSVDGFSNLDITLHRTKSSENFHGQNRSYASFFFSFFLAIVAALSPAAVRRCGTLYIGPEGWPSAAFMALLHSLRTRIQQVSCHQAGRQFMSPPPSFSHLSHPLRASSPMLWQVFGACCEYSSTVKDPCRFREVAIAAKKETGIFHISDTVRGGCGYVEGRRRR